MRILLTTLILTIGATVNAWEVRDHYKDDSKYILILRDDNSGSLGSIIGNESRTLSDINLGRVIQIKADGLQKDIVSYLSANYENELEAALSSSGNMHNPKVIPLRRLFEEAIYHSKYIQFIDDILCINGYEIKGVSTEKFMILESNNEKYFDAMAWLKIKQLTNQITRTCSSPALMDTF